MNKLESVLVANRGEIAIRLIKGAKSLGLRALTVYATTDSSSQHVVAADEAYLLDGEARAAYLDSDQIITIAKEHGAQAIIPGYGFLSENADFARATAAAGLVFVGPSPEAMESFALKYSARELAIKAGVPVVPGSEGVLETEDAAVSAAVSCGFPVMLKATAGGGGMGLLACHDEEDVRNKFQTVQSRGASLFKHGGVFLERYLPDSHHVEVQVFGNGTGKAISIGERECSIQRRHQKVIEECPSPFVTKNLGLREKLTRCAVELAESVDYGSAGTVEFLVDDETGDFFFLEMNTRLQVEHGITELCYGVDIAELMLRQADRQFQGKGGLGQDEMAKLQDRCLQPRGHAIEARVYAENPARDYTPSPGLLQDVSWYQPPGTRIDTWVRAGMSVSADFDPLLAKVMFHGASRAAAIEGIAEVLRKSSIDGPPINLEFLHAIVQDPGFVRGNTTTRFLDSFGFVPPAIDVVSGGSYTLIQDYPGRPTIGHGFGHAGPMDPMAFRTANILVGNPEGTEGLEITMTGPDLRFLGDAIVALCGPPVPAELDGKDISLWTRHTIHAGQRLTIGKMSAHCRVYLAVYGGFSNVATWFGSKSTNPMVGIGGYQGRPLRAGDYLRIVDKPVLPLAGTLGIPPSLWPVYPEEWDIQVMSGPYETGYLSPGDMKRFYSHTWTVSHNAARGGIRLLGPRPSFARQDGGDGGAHPSNVIEYGYPLGGLNWTGDEPVIFPADCPDFGGFICSVTVVKADMWKVGQLRPGDRVRFRRIDYRAAVHHRRRHEDFLDKLASAVKAGGTWDSAVPFDSTSLGEETTGGDVIKVLDATSSSPNVYYRQGGDDYVLVDYGEGKFDLNYKCRATALQRMIESGSGPVALRNKTDQGAILNMVGCGNSLAIFYDGLRLSQNDLVGYLVKMEGSLGDMHAAQLPNRRFRLPLTFTHKRLDEALQRYMANQRSTASYLPDPFQFVASNNGMTPDELKTMLLDMESVVVGVGFFMGLPICLPTDPRCRLAAPKWNPSRTHTPEGTLGWGGSCMAIYPLDCPGGYMPLGMTLPGLDVFGAKQGGFREATPWLFEDMDVLSFYHVSEEEFDVQMAQFRAGTYTFDVQDDTFDMQEHNRLLETTAEDVRRLKGQRAAAQDKMTRLERELLEKWLSEKNASTPDFNLDDALDQDAATRVIEAPMNANVWKVLVQPGQTLEAGQTVAILEAMKMETNVLVDADLAAATVIKVLVQPGESIESGQPIALVKKDV